MNANSSEGQCLKNSNNKQRKQNVMNEVENNTLTREHKVV